MTPRPEDHESDAELASDNGSGAESEWTDKSETEETDPCTLPAQGPVYDDNTMNWILATHTHTMLNRYNKMNETIAESKAIKAAQAKVDAERANLDTCNHIFEILVELGERMKRGKEDTAREELKAELEAIRSELGDEARQMMRSIVIAAARNEENQVATESEG